MAHDPEEKLKIVLEGLTEDITITDLCKKYDISRETFYTWRDELKDGALKHWSDKTPGRNPDHHFETKSEAEQAYKEAQEELEQQKEENFELKKELEGVTLQRDFYQFRFENRFGDNDDSDSDKKKLNLEEKKWLLELKEQKELVTQSEYADLIGVDSSSIYRWEIQAENDCLENEPPVPKNFPQATDISIVKRVLEVFMDFPDWGGESISNYLLNNKITYLSPGTAQKVKNKANKILENTEYELKAKMRYEALNPDDIWAIDFLEFDWYDQTIYIAILIDDHSRYVLNWYLSTGPTSEFVINMIDEAIEQYGSPKVIKTDNGPQFRKTFQKKLNERNIVQLNSPLYTPSYNGKVERVNRYIREIVDELENLEMSNIIAGVEQAIKDHNFVRPHQALGGVTPEQRYQGKARQIKKEMEQFKKQEKQKRGFSTQSDSEEAQTQINKNSTSKGITAPVKRGGEKIISVRFFSNIYLAKDLD